MLVISSDPQLRERLYDRLSPQGLLVSTAVSFQNGLEILQHGQPVHLLILDAAISGEQSAKAMTRIRQYDEDLPVIMLTSPGQEGLDTSTIRQTQACLPNTADTRTVLAAITRWMTPPRLIKKIHYPGPILIVDDEPELLNNLEAFLRPRGCDVVKATSGEEALQCVARACPALVLLDIKMPGMDGLVTLKKIKALKPDLPVILASALEDQSLLEQAVRLGAYDYIVKPYNLTVLEGLLGALKPRAKKAIRFSAE